MFNRAEIVDKNFIRFVQACSSSNTSSRPVQERTAPVFPPHPLTGDELLQLFESQAITRHLDFIARKLRTTQQSFYTIGSAGHEGNAVLGLLSRMTDPALLHYRSGAFMAERSRKSTEANIVRDTLLSMVASSDDPIAGGRHKVWGSKPLWVLPQTSTIASHLHKAVGMAIGIKRAAKLDHKLEIPNDSIVICSFGEAGSNHSAAQGAINAACYAAHQRIPVPILFVCEDNGIGISVPTAPRWIESNFANRPYLKYLHADGLNVVEAHAVASDAMTYCRERRAPVFLHLNVVRLLGHAGTDMEAAYRPLDAIEADERRDPLLKTVELILKANLLSPAEVLAQYESIRWRVEECAGEVIARPKLKSRQEVIEPLAPYHADLVEAESKRTISVEPAIETAPRHLAVQINSALRELMHKYPQITIFGEDVAKKGGVYYVTAGLHDRFGVARVFNTLLDEQSILGLAQGFGSLGLLPFPEIQYLAYVHNAIDQLRGEACSLQFFSNDQFRNPMVIRIASLAYQKGFGGHFHNDNSIAALREIPGLIIAVPSRGDDAVEMLRTCAALSVVDGRIVAYLEPIALYMTKDLYEDGDGLWQTTYPEQGRAISVGDARVYFPEHRQVTIVTYGNGVYFSLRAAKHLEASGVKARIVDLRWLSPLNETLIAEQARTSEHVLVVDECRRSGGISDAVIATIVEQCETVPPLRRVTALDTYIPLGPAANLVLPNEQQIVSAVKKLCRC